MTGAVLPSSTEVFRNRTSLSESMNMTTKTSSSGPNSTIDAQGNQLFSRAHPGEIYYVSLSPDGRRVASWDGTRHFRIRHRYSGSVEVDFKVQRWVFDGHWVSKSDIVVVFRTWNDKMIGLVHSANPNHILELDGHTSGINSIAFSPDGSRLASGGYDETIRIWKLDDVITETSLSTVTQPTCCHVLRGHASSVINGLSFSSTSTRMVSAAENGTIQMWNIMTGTPQGPTYQVINGKVVPIKTTTGAIKATLQQTEEVQQEDYLEVEWSPAPASGTATESIVVSSKTYSKIFVITAHNGAVIQSLNLDDGTPFFVSWCPLGKRISFAMDHEVVIWTPATNTYDSRARIHRGDAIFALSWAKQHAFPHSALTPKEHTLVAGSKDGDLKLWDIAAPQSVQMLGQSPKKVSYRDMLATGYNTGKSTVQVTASRDLGRVPELVQETGFGYCSQGKLQDSGERKGLSIDKPMIKKPSIEKPSIDKFAYDKPSIEKPSIEKPSIDKPSIDTPDHNNISVEKVQPKAKKSSNFMNTNYTMTSRNKSPKRSMNEVIHVGLASKAAGSVVVMSASEVVNDRCRVKIQPFAFEPEYSRYKNRTTVKLNMIKFHVQAENIPNEDDERIGKLYAHCFSNIVVTIELKRAPESGGPSDDGELFYRGTVLNLDHEEVLIKGGERYLSTINAGFRNKLAFNVGRIKGKDSEVTRPCKVITNKAWYEDMCNDGWMLERRFWTTKGTDSYTLFPADPVDCLQHVEHQKRYVQKHMVGWSERNPTDELNLHPSGDKDAIGVMTFDTGRSIPTRSSSNGTETSPVPPHDCYYSARVTITMTLLSIKSSKSSLRSIRTLSPTIRKVVAEGDAIFLMKGSASGPPAPSTRNLFLESTMETTTQ